MHSKMGSLFIFSVFDISHGDTQAGITLNGSFGEGTWAQKSPGRKKKKTTYKANDGNLSLAVLGEIISFVTLFFSFFSFFPFVSLVFSNLSWTSTFGVSNVPHNLNLRFSLRVLPVYFASCDFFNLPFFIFTSSSTVSFMLVSVYSM